MLNTIFRRSDFNQGKRMIIGDNRTATANAKGGTGIPVAILVSGDIMYNRCFCGIGNCCVPAG
jgi:hypothetical protein